MENKFDPKAFLNDSTVKPYADGYASGHNDALEWAAKWIENSATTNGHPAAIEFAKNMAMTFRAAFMKNSPADLPQKYMELRRLAIEYMEAEKAYRLAHDRGEAGPGLTLRANKADAALRAALDTAAA